MWALGTIKLDNRHIMTSGRSISLTYKSLSRSGMSSWIWSPVFCINNSHRQQQRMCVNLCFTHTAVQSENGGSGVCCSSAVRGLQRCRERHAELPWTFNIHTPWSLFGCGLGLHTHPRHRCCVFRKMHIHTQTHVHTYTLWSTSGHVLATTPVTHHRHLDQISRFLTAHREKYLFTCCQK